MGGLKTAVRFHVFHPSPCADGKGGGKVTLLATIVNTNKKGGINVKKYAYTKSFTDADGKRHKVYADTRKELNEKYIRALERTEKGIRSISKTVTVAKWSEEWMKTYKENSVSPESLHNIKSILRNAILPQIGHMMVKNVKPIHIQAMINSCSGRSRSGIRYILGVTGQMFRDAKLNGLIYENPCEGIVLPKAEDGTRRSLTEYERENILILCETHPLGLALKIMLYCGLRPGEVCALQWRHIDPVNGMLTVDSAAKKLGGIGTPKTKAGIRKIPIPKVLDLKRPRGTSPFDFVCKSRRGLPLKLSNFQRMWESFKNDLNIQMGCESYKGKAVPPFRVAPDLVPYVLRHTYCTDLQAAGVPINVAKELMGHSDISITSRIYTHSSQASLENAREKIDEFSVKRDTLRDTLTEMH